MKAFCFSRSVLFLFSLIFSQSGLASKTDAPVILSLDFQSRMPNGGVQGNRCTGTPISSALIENRCRVEISLAAHCLVEKTGRRRQLISASVGNLGSFPASSITMRIALPYFEFLKGNINGGSTGEINIGDGMTPEEVLYELWSNQTASWDVAILKISTINTSICDRLKNKITTLAALDEQGLPVINDGDEIYYGKRNGELSIATLRKYGSIDRDTFAITLQPHRTWGSVITNGIPVISGDSGGPVFNADDEMIGVTSIVAEGGFPGFSPQAVAWLLSEMD